VRESNVKLLYTSQAAARRIEDLLPLLPEDRREQHVRTAADFHRRYVEALASEFGKAEISIDLDRLIEGFPALPPRTPFVPTEAQVREDLAKSMAAVKRIRAESASSAPSSIAVEDTLDERE